MAEKFPDFENQAWCVEQLGRKQEFWNQFASLQG